MLLGFLAMNEHSGRLVSLTDDKHPRKQLLAKLGARSCVKMYTEMKTGPDRHIGYIVRDGWWRIYEVHDWKGSE